MEVEVEILCGFCSFAQVLLFVTFLLSICANYTPYQGCLGGKVTFPSLRNQAWQKFSRA